MQRAIANRRAKSRLLRLAAAAACFGCLAPADAAKTWDQVANIRDATKRLVEMHRAQGSRGVIKFLDACYRTHSLASAYSAPLEACMAQDYIHSRVLTAIYARLPEDAAGKGGIPSPELITRSMEARFGSILGQYAIAKKDAEALVANIEKHGLPVFLNAAFPAKAREDESAKGGSKAKAP